MAHQSKWYGRIAVVLVVAALLWTGVRVYQIYTYPGCSGCGSWPVLYVPSEFDHPQ